MTRLHGRCPIGGPMDGAAFLTHPGHCLTPTPGPGDIVVMDDQPARKVNGIHDIPENAGTQLCYPPPYSPDLNPIENTFAKLKTLIRSAAERTIDGLQQQIGKAREAFPKTGCTNNFCHDG